jgi:Protein kinase domain
VATPDYHPNLEPGLFIAGRYSLMEKIGQGGMGEVWVAKQTEPVKRKVALKLIKTGLDSKAVLTRFEQERQALALMDHPNIARVFDGGLTPTGQPFFVMKLVNGLALTKFCDEVRLTLKERLELFVPICQAVQHAHQFAPGTVARASENPSQGQPAINRLTRPDRHGHVASRKIGRGRTEPARVPGNPDEVAARSLVNFQHQVDARCRAA